MNIVSFSLFGDNPLYTEGAVENAKLCRTVYPDWTVCFYAGDDVPPSIISELKNAGASVFQGQILFSDNRKNLARAPFWRFMANDIPGAEYCIFRDCDSRVGIKERAAVDQWIESGKDFHFLYDHPYHNIEILAGMWGVRAGAVPDMTGLINEFFPADLSVESYKSYTDQSFLRQTIWPRFVNSGNYLAHGTPESTVWHRERGIVISPYPAARGFFDSARQSYIGQTIQVPGARAKDRDY